MPENAYGRVGVGSMLREWRERALLTQEQLAERTGLAVRTIRRLESGDAAGRPLSSSIRALATALELSEAEHAALVAATRDAPAADENADRPVAPWSPPGDTLRQLPAPPPGFVGRVAELAGLDRAVDASAVVITAIDGMAGVGKTALAVHAAHQLTGHFPDGQLFVDLHGYTEGVAPVEPAEALERILRALGVPGQQLPAHLDDRAALYRSRLADRKLLVLLDNAADEGQVAPLIPGTPGCLVLVTSRRRLTGLDGTHTFSLDVLPLPDAVALFTGTVGEDRARDTDAVAEVVELCGRLPLAIRIAAARLRSRPAWTVEHLTERLRDHRRRLAELEAGPRSVAATLEVSYRDLDPRLRRAYRLLGLHPGADLDAYAAAALLDATASDARLMVDRLIDAHLLQEPAPGRFQFHDLVRDHARATSSRDETETDRRAATTRLLDHYRHAASVAMGIAYPRALYRRPDVPPAHTPTPTLPDPVKASAWLDGELSNLVAAAQHAAEHGWPGHAPHLSSTLHLHLRERGHHADAATLHQHALAAARASGNRAGEADALALLGVVHWQQGRLDQAGELLELAVATARAVDRHLAEVMALTTLGYVRSVQGAYERAMEHFATARDGARRISDRGTELEALYGLAYLHMQHGGGPAMDEFEECLALARAAGDSTGERMALQGLGHAHRTQGRFEQAVDCFEQALRISRAGGNERGNPSSLLGLAFAHREQGNDAQAAYCFQQVVNLARDMGNPNWEFEGTHGLGRLDLAAGRWERALAHHQRALELATQLGQPADEARANDGLALAHRALGERENARRHWLRALEILTDLGADSVEGGETTTATIRANLIDLDENVEGDSPQ